MASNITLRAHRAERDILHVKMNLQCIQQDVFNTSDIANYLARYEKVNAR